MVLTGVLMALCRQPDLWHAGERPDSPSADFRCRRPLQLLQQNGVYVLENVNTTVLIADDVHEFLFVLAPLRIGGAAQWPVNPIAIR